MDHSLKSEKDNGTWQTVSCFCMIPFFLQCSWYLMKNKVVFLVISVNPEKKASERGLKEEWRLNWKETNLMKTGP